LGTITTREVMENYVAEQIMTTKEGDKIMFMEQCTIKKKEQIISVWKQLQPEREWRITPWNKS
jgi:hypothetical protein